MGRSTTILLVEDNQDDVLFFRLGASERQTKIIHVSDAQAAMSQLETNPLPDLIVLDLKLPGVSVSTFLDWVRDHPDVQKIPIVIHTGAMKVPDEVTSVVRNTFFKSGDLVKTRFNVLQMIGLAEAG